jgi:hypothetical protein
MGCEGVLDELVTAYYEMAFRTRFAFSKGEEFQNLFSSLMELRYPGDFVRVRPWGKLGDRKNDGYLPSKRRLHQCYAPRELGMATCQKKINEDFSEALPYWKEHFDEWIFTHNDSEGLPADILKLLLDLTAANEPVRVLSWGYAELRVEFQQLNEKDTATLLGPAPSRRDIVDVGVPEVQSLLEHIALQPEPPDPPVSGVPAQKIEYNQLSPAAATLLKAGMTRSEIVKKYFRGIADQTRYDRMAATFRGEYLRLRSEGLMPDEIFAGLQIFVAGRGVPSTARQAATLAVLAFFFEACEIFERPPDRAEEQVA